MNKIKLSLWLSFSLATLLFSLPLGTCHARAFSACAHNFQTYSFLEEIDNHILSLRAKNIPQAYYKYTSKEFRKKTSYPDFQDIITKYPSLHDNISITLRGIQFQEETGRYSGILTAKNGEEILIEYELLKQGDTWKILGFTLFKAPTEADRSAMTKNKDIKLAQVTKNRAEESKNYY